MTSVKLLILAAALAVIATARVAVLPGWVVPVPALFLAIMLTAVAGMALALVLRVRMTRIPVPAATAPAARRVIRGEVTR